MKTNIQNQTRGCIGEEFDLMQVDPEKARHIGATYRPISEAKVRAMLKPEHVPDINDPWDDEPYHAAQYDWRWLYVPCAAAITLITLLWWLWPKLIAMRMGDGTP